jgi:flavodoxin
MKAIIYASVHHGNTKKVVEAIAKECNVELIDATQVREKDLRGYDSVGFASGIYYSKFHQSVLNFASVNLPQDKKVFYICTNGGNASYKSIEEITNGKNAIEIGRFSCKGYDTFGPFKLVGGLAKGHPDESDLKNAVEFFKGLD